MAAATNLQVAFDEAGNTGANLLDPDQPVFVLASLCVSYAETEPLARAAAGQATEAHFVRMRRSKGGRQRILEVLNAPSLVGRVRLSAYHKPFMVTTKIIDLLIETMAHEDGLDLYERGANIAMANLWHAGLPVVIGVDRFIEFQRLFVDIVRKRSWPAVLKFHRFVGRLLDELRGETWEMHLGLLFASIERVAMRDYHLWGDGHLDPAFPSFVDLGCYWTGELGEPFDIVHDESEIIENEQELLEFLMSIDHPTQVIGYDRRKSHFPIKATGLQLVNSENHPEVQLADIIASSAAYGWKKRALHEHDSFADEILASPVLSADHNVVWPTRLVTPQELGTEEVGGINSADHIAEFVRERRAAPKQ